MMLAFEYVSMDPGTDGLTVFSHSSGEPVYGVVDGMKLYMAGGEMPRPATYLYGCSQHRNRQIKITKTTASEHPYHGVVYASESLFEGRGVTRREIEIVNVTADSVSELIHKMNRDMFLIRQSLAEITY